MFAPLILACATAVTAPEPPSPAPSAPAIGARIASFTLDDIHRRPHSLDRYGDKRAIVVVFIGTECPLANLYVPTLVDLHAQYADRGVQWIAINSNSHDSFIEVSAHAQERAVPFPVLKDFRHEAADALGAKRTPEAFLLDPDLVIRYHGRIDDQYGIGYQREGAREHYLRNAIDQLLAGEPVSPAETEAPGCIIARARRPRKDSAVSYTRDVAPILQRRCQACHRPGQIGPFSLLSFGDAQAWAETIHEVVLERRMPPWHADPRYGKFRNDRRLTESEMDTLLAWVEGGSAKGEDRDLPPPAEFPENWTIGKPDLELSMPEQFTVPASGVVPYKRFVVDPGFAEDRWVQAAEARPGNRAVVHHILVYIQLPGKRLFEADGTASTLVGWAPGDMPAVYEPGTAKRIPAGAKLVFEVHYTPNGTEQADRSSVGIIFASQPPEQIAETNILANWGIRIPPGVANHQGQLTYVFKKDARILAFMPHMHLRGLRAEYQVTYPDGTIETLLSVPDYDFNWQSVYRFVEPVRIPQGTKLTWTAYWDNSASNPRNPDPTKEVRWGEQTWDEMMNGWMDVVWERPHPTKSDAAEAQPGE